MSLAHLTNCEPLQIHRAFTTTRAINRRQSSIYSALFLSVNEATYRTMGQLNKLSNQRSCRRRRRHLYHRATGRRHDYQHFVASRTRVSRHFLQLFSLARRTRQIRRDIARSYDRRTIIVSRRSGGAPRAQLPATHYIGITIVWE